MNVFWIIELHNSDALPPMGRDKNFVSPQRNSPYWTRAFSLSRRQEDEWSLWRRNLHLTTNNTHKRQTFKTPTGFERTIPASEGQQIHALDRSTTGIKDLQIPIIIRLGKTQSWYGNFEDPKISYHCKTSKFSFFILQRSASVSGNNQSSVPAVSLRDTTCLCFDGSKY
jgi:hypothetical protein